MVERRERRKGWERGEVGVRVVSGRRREGRRVCGSSGWRRGTEGARGRVV